MLIKTGDVVQTYAYGQHAYIGKVLSVSMGQAEVELQGEPRNRAVTWVHMDFLTKIG